LVWKGGGDDLNPSGFGQILAEEFQASGFKAETNTANLFDAGTQADLQIAALVDDMKGRFCRSCGLRPDTSEVSGAVLMGIEWQVYSTLDRKIVARVRTTGGFETDTAQVGNELRIVMEAFRRNISKEHPGAPG
jgi:hypothetical protein